MKIVIALLLMLSCNIAYSRSIYKVAVIDTGFTFLPFDLTGFKICPSGHYDFDKKKSRVGPDVAGHGSYVTSLINIHADTSNICFLIYKVFGEDVSDSHKAIDSAMIKAYRAGAKAINMSVFMVTFSKRTLRIIKYLTKHGVVFYVSAGNEGRNLNKTCLRYPVCYKELIDNKRVKIVGALNVYDNPALYSNKGARIDLFSFGDYNVTFRGTSLAAPRALGDYIKELGL